MRKTLVKIMIKTIAKSNQKIIGQKASNQSNQ